MKKLLIVLLIVAILFIGIADAKKIITEKGKHKDTGGDVEIDISNYNLTVTDDTFGIGVSSNVKVNGNKKTLLDDKEKYVKTMTATITPTPTPGGDPQVVFQYELDGNRLKETITIESDCQISFPLTIPADKKIIPWYGGTWKIVSATSGDTVSGIVAEKPFGVDAAGHYIEMNYSWDGQNLNLNYERTVPVFNESASTAGNPVYDYFDISYPLTIDPTWVSYSGHYKSTSGLTVLEMWNATGYTTWTVPEGIYPTVNFFVLGGGGAGGGAVTGQEAAGGGAGGFRTSWANDTVSGNNSAVESPLTLTAGQTLTIFVGAGGIGANASDSSKGNPGGNSTLGTIISNGGGGGATYAGTGMTGNNGGSGGGGSDLSAAGGSGSPGQGSNGGYGHAGGASNDGTGGGGGGAGKPGQNGNDAGTSGKGGDGLWTGIDGVMTRYAAGGGAGAYNNHKQAGGFSGMGGTGGQGSTSTSGTDGAKGTGSGGGALGGDGSDGIVIVRYSVIPTINSSFSSTNVTVATNSSTAGAWSGNPPFTMRFTNTSTGVEQSSWVWNYTKVGDAQPTTFNQSTFYDTYYTFSSAGNYSISLNATSSLASNISIQTTWVNLSSPVTWSANKTYGMVGLGDIAFTDTSPLDGGTYNWTFDSLGNYSASRNVTHTYTDPGLYTVRFTSPYPGVDYLERTNYINISAPSFTCTPLYGMPPLTVGCNDTSSILTNDVLWDMGDGFTSHTTGNIEHTYSTNGSYSVTLKTPYSTGVNTTVSGYVNVGTISPGADFTSNVTEVAAGGYVAFTDLSTNTPTSWKWSFNGGTGSDSTSQNPTYQFNTVGNFSVNLTATNAASSSSTVKTNYIWVHPAGWYAGMQPITAADFTVSPYAYTNVNNPLTFTGTVTTGTAQYYKWDFNGGTVVDNTTAVASHTYTTAGNKTINFTTWNAISSYSVIKPDYITVYGAGIPHAAFYGQPLTGSPGFLVNFYDQSLKGTTSSLVYNWSFGDATYSTTPFSSIQGNVQHVYAYSGIYDVNLSIVNANGTSFEFKQQYVVISNAQTMTWWSPHQVVLKVVDMNGVPLEGVSITANVVESTLPGGISGAKQTLISNYGISDAAATQMVNTTLYLSGTTGTDGRITFTMLGSLQYMIVTTDASGNSYTTKLYPLDDHYQIWTGSATTKLPTQGNNTYSEIANSTLTFSEPNMSYMTMGLDYLDISGKTDAIQFYVRLVDNNTVMFSRNYSVSGAQHILVNYTVPNVRTQQWKWWYDAHRSA